MPSPRSRPSSSTWSADSASTYGLRSSMARASAGWSARSWSRPVTSASSRIERACSASIIARIAVASGPGARSANRRNVPMSAFASESSALSSTDLKNGQLRYTSTSWSMISRPPRAVDRLEGRAQAVPAGQVGARLRPREHPGDRPERGELLARRRSPPPSPLGRDDGRDPRPRPAIRSIGVAARKKAGKRRQLDERPVGRARDRRQLGHDARAPLGRRRDRALVLGGGGQQHGRGDLLEVPLGDGRVGVVGRDDLALLGELEPAVHGAGRLREDRAVGGPAAAADGAAATVEQRERDAVAPGDGDQRLLRLVEQPVGGQDAALLGRVRVAQHHLLARRRASGGARGRPGREAGRRAGDPRPRAPRPTRGAARRRGPGPGRAGRPGRATGR